MNPHMRNRIAAGDFARVTLDEETTFSGYIAADPADPSVFRMDGYVLGAAGHLEGVSLRLADDDIHQIQFLPEPPVFVDAEGHDLVMVRGFFPG
ncbi:MAG: hypothetical protein SFU85_10375 [Candidatus Methylacidiphilales bacterium]|nr:hypothetical protein [Candidatus Methylacidiphilales bacterium]